MSQTNEKIQTTRENFEKYKDNPSKCLELLKQLENDPTPEIQGYRAMYSFMMANHSFDPFSKWHYFSKGKKILENQISLHPDNIELRLLRFAIQTNLPSFLGYNASIDTDKKVLLDALKNNRISNTYLKSKITEILKASYYLTTQEKQAL